ncbi:MAG: CrcB family protein [Prevotella sp.]|nr:CrcB family protein [Prevotella sp.]
MKEFIIVGIGSFFGGGLRYAVGRIVGVGTSTVFPLSTFVVNIVGCLLIGMLSTIALRQGWLTPTMRLLLITGFCGGFTTFSTFISENVNLCSSAHQLMSLAYMSASIIVGIVAFWLGCMIIKIL